MSRVSSFPPIIDKKSCVLILGSMPGGESLRKQEYYANVKNQFWKIIYALFDISPDNSYEKRIMFLKDKGIGLWDVMETCYRKGSLDSDITKEKVNNFDSLFREFPNIKYVCFNGLKAFDTYQKKVGFNKDIIFERLESTSPANTMRFEDKLKNWMIIKTYLNS